MAPPAKTPDLTHSLSTDGRPNGTRRAPAFYRVRSETCPPRAFRSRAGAFRIMLTIAYARSGGKRNPAGRMKNSGPPAPAVAGGEPAYAGVRLRAAACYGSSNGRTPRCRYQSNGTVWPPSRQRRGQTLSIHSSGSPGGWASLARAKARRRASFCSGPTAPGLAEMNSGVPLPASGHSPSTCWRHQATARRMPSS